MPHMAIASDEAPRCGTVTDRHDWCEKKGAAFVGQYRENLGKIVG